VAEPLGEQSTDGVVLEPWKVGPAVPGATELHLVIAWFIDEPDRVGQAARLDQVSWLGRLHEDYLDEPPIQFLEQRPGETLGMPELVTTKISRRQLRFTRLNAEQSRVENVGRRPLYVNGKVMREATVQAGDTLMLEHTAVFLVEARPRELPPLAHYPAVRFRFGTPDPQGMVGESPAAWLLRDQLAGAARADAHALLLGETGAGKEVAAGVVHGLSPRARGPMVARNATTIPGTLLDAELFGCAKNFPNTGTPEREGLVAAASGGHLMLDEIGELLAGHQAHLLRVLDSGGKYHRLGETRERVSNFRLIGATNRDPARLKHDFLARFAYRIVVPGLNDRRSDIPFLVSELIRRAAQSSFEVVRPFLEDGDPERPHIRAKLMDRLLRHNYTEHTRELARLLHLAMSTSRGRVLDLTPEVEQALEGGTLTPPPALSANSPEPTASSGAATPAPTATATARRPSERPSAPPDQPTVQEIAEALRDAGGSVVQAAERLGVSRYVLHRWIRVYGLVKKFE
jgi:DNA-binding NtrC family response regulator